VPAIRPTVDLRLRRYRPLHVRYALFRRTDGGARRYVLERGFDMADPKDGKARADTFVLEFRDVPPELRGLLGV
jgi:hypothetical protein